MKTFETEKNNIPEGATHYSDETSSDYFAWFKGVESGDFAVMVIGTSHWVRGRKSHYLDLAKPIPQTKEVEWVNGEPLEYKGEDDEWEHNGRYVCFDGYGEHHVFTARDGMMYHASDEQIRKPETEAERVERERLEAAYDLYLDFYQDYNPCHDTIESFDCSRDKDLWLRTVDKTNYRKESE